MGLETNELELDDLKWIILMVLFNVPGMRTLIRLWKSSCTAKSKVFFIKPINVL